MDDSTAVSAPYPHREDVEAAITAFFADSLARSARYGQRYRELWHTIERGTRGGKRFRPRLVMIAYQACGGTDPIAAAHLAASYELLHSALIEHDDVIDRDFYRRGRENVSGTYRDIAATAGLSLPTAEHRGLSVGVIAGDLALSAAYRLLERSIRDAPTELARLLREILDDAVEASAAGELLDVDFSVLPGVPSVDEVLEMERLKTAVYTFEAPLRAGALLAGASVETAAALAQAGTMIGVAYQIIDDLLGVFGDEATTGKSTFGDLREGKRTAIIAHAAQTTFWPQIAAVLGKTDLTEAEAAQLRELLEAAGSRRYVELLAQDFTNRGWEALAHEAVPETARAALRPLIRDVLERVS